MKETTPSATALIVALIRAVHTRTAPQPLINDPWGEQLVPDAVSAAIVEALLGKGGGSHAAANAPAMQAADLDTLLQKNPAYANVILRSRYTEDALDVAVARGVKQYVLIGAGLDSYALRVPPAAQQLEIFEIDHPATQGYKTAMLAELGLADAAAAHFVSADLSQESLGSALSRSAFNPQEQTFFSLLGVTMYLSRQDNKSLMREISRCACPGSELVFTYVDEVAFSPDTSPELDQFKSMQKGVAAVSEPFLSGFDPGTLSQNLGSLGLRLDEDQDDLQLIERYDSQGVNRLRSSSIGRIARVCVVDDGH